MISREFSGPGLSAESLYPVEISTGSIFWAYPVGPRGIVPRGPAEVGLDYWLPGGPVVPSELQQFTVTLDRIAAGLCVAIEAGSGSSRLGSS